MEALLPLPKFDIYLPLPKFQIDLACSSIFQPKTLDQLIIPILFIIIFFKKLLISHFIFYFLNVKAIEEIIGLGVPLHNLFFLTDQQKCI